jgi:hypothetical protein
MATSADRSKIGEQKVVLSTDSANPFTAPGLFYLPGSIQPLLEEPTIIRFGYLDRCTPTDASFPHVAWTLETLTEGKVTHSINPDPDRPGNYLVEIIVMASEGMHVSLVREVQPGQGDETRWEYINPIDEVTPLTSRAPLFDDGYTLNEPIRAIRMTM